MYLLVILPLVVLLLSLSMEVGVLVPVGGGTYQSKDTSGNKERANVQSEDFSLSNDGSFSQLPKTTTKRIVALGPGVYRTLFYS